MELLMEKHIKRFKQLMKKTLIRLVENGYCEKDAKDMIGIVLYENKNKIQNYQLVDAWIQLENLK